MAKTFRLWIEIEEYDDETDEYRQPFQPVPMGKFNTPEEAVENAEEFDNYYGDCT